MIRWLKEMLLLNLLLLPPMAFLPFVCVALAVRPDPGMALPLFFFAPLSAGFWVLVYSQWLSAMAWQRAGRLKQWRSDHGGLLCTIPRACGWLLFGIVASFLSEIAFMLAFMSVPHGMFDGEARLRLWLSLFPVACYFPLVPAWVWRRRHV